MTRRLEEMKDSIFKLWSKIGPSYKHTMYFNFRLQSFEEYCYLLCEFYGLDSSTPVQSVIGEMVWDGNIEITKHEICGKGLIELQYIKLMSSEEEVMRKLYDGYGGNFKDLFIFEKDPLFECPEEDEYGDCYDYQCVVPVANEVHKMLYKKYGIHINHTMASDRNDDNYIPV